MGIFRELRLIIWKNGIIRKRHWFLTIIEILIPTIMFGLLAFGRSKITGMTKEIITEPMYMDAETSSGLESHVPVGDMQLWYAPYNNFTEQIISRVQEVFQIPGSDKRNFRSKEDILKFYLKNTDKNIYAVVFDTSNEKQLSYELSINGKTLDWKTGRLHESFEMDPAEDSSAIYIYKGFVGLQYAINKAFLELNTDASSNISLTLERFPYPPHIQDNGIKNLFLMWLTLCTIFSFIFLCPSVLKRVVEEKSSGIKELMKMVGMKPWMTWCGWFLHALSTNVVSIGIIMVLMKVPLWGVDYPPIEHCDPGIFFLFLFLYCMAAITFCFMIASMFEKPLVAMICGIIIWVFSYIFPKWLLSSYEDHMSWKSKIAIGLVFPNIALDFGYQAISTYEKREIGVQWTNLAKSAEGSENDITMLSVFIIFALETVIFMIITIYVDNVKPGQYGIAKPLSYPFYAMMKPFVKLIRSSSKVGSPESCQLNQVERGHSFKKPCIEVNHLTKRYGANVAVDDLCMDIYENQITVLLGHNGAGKTTTMSIITGMTSATRGNVLIHGKNINRSMSDVRESMGLCPQHNLLFPDLTVKEQLLFFAMLKGKSRAEAENQAKEILSDFNLFDKRNEMASKLSGGMKRKLCLGMALIGDTKLLILDEPTSGMDTESRRKVWDLLKEKRINRTILITTHFMEEADALADDIIILSHGRLTCQGAPMKLKNTYGTGYHLSLMLDNMTVDKMRKIKELGLQLEREHGNNAVFVLPMSKKHLYGEILRKLEESKQDLGISKIGLSLTTLTDVFLKASKAPGDESCTETDSNKLAENVQKLAGRPSDANIWRILEALFLKRAYFAKNRYYWYIPAILVTLAIFLIVVCFGASSTNYYGHGGPAINLNLTIYGKTGVFYGGPENVGIVEKMKMFYAKSISAQGSTPIDTNDVRQAIIEKGTENIVYYKKHLVAAAEFKQVHDRTIVNALYSGSAIHAAPIAINLAMNAIAKSLLGDDFAINAINSPFKRINTEFSPAEISEIDVGLLWFILVPFAMLFFMTNYIIFPSFEIATNFIRIQLMAGVHIVSYWATNFVWDFFSGIVKLGIIGVLIYLVDLVIYDSTIFHKEEYVVLSVIFATYLVSNLPYCYQFAYCRTIAGGFALFIMTGIFMGIIPTVVVLAMQASQDPFYMNIAQYLKYILLAIYPQFGLSLFCVNFARKYVENHNWVHMAEEKRLTLCGANPNPCCYGENSLECVLYKSYFHNETLGIHHDFLLMLFSAFLYFLILYLRNLNVWHKLRLIAFQLISRGRGKKTVTNENSENVSRTSDINKAGLKAENLQVTYDRDPVVNISLMELDKNRCSGLLGVNGAGKTTTFKSLTKQIAYNIGNIFIQGDQKDTRIDINNPKYETSIGYCPQEDSLNFHLTAVQILTTIGLIRGLDWQSAQESAELLLEWFDLTEYANMPCITYSGGNKRKLNTCIAFMAIPDYILLDEPTNGVDPASRRLFWSVLTAVKNQQKSSFLLCSHSMEECEALCDTISIMKAGKIERNAPLLELKKEFNSGYTVKFQFKELPPPDEVDCGRKKYKKLDQNEKEAPFAKVKDEITKKLQQKLSQRAIVMDDHSLDTLTLNLIDPNTRLSGLFAEAEGLKEEFADLIEDYTVTETSLEDVFLLIAKTKD